MKKKKVLLLGAAGRIGTDFVEEYWNKYRKYYELILGVHSKKFKDKRFKVVKFELGNIKSLKKAMKNIGVVIALAANPRPPAEFKDLIKPNLIGAYNIFEAARQARCERVVFASSVHVVRGYPLGKEVKHNQAPMPPNFYGASKVFGEALCSVFSQKYNLSCLAIRIGAYVSDEQKKTVCHTRKDFDYVISQRDMAQLIHKCVVAKKSVKYGILSGSSNNKRKYLGLDFTKKLVGYKPQDDAFKICKVINKSKLK